jgi:hypothetical protein
MSDGKEESSDANLDSVDEEAISKSMNGVGAYNFYGWTGTRKWTVDRPAKGTPVEDGSSPENLNDDRISGSAGESAVESGRHCRERRGADADSCPRSQIIARLDNSRMVERSL